MFTPLTVLLVIAAYMASLFALAQWVERRIENKQFNANKPWMYALSLAVFHTSWTFYGSVGFASESGFLYLAIYVGALLGILLGWISFRRMIRVKEHLHITSVADFIASRYNRSGLIASFITVMMLVGLVPYIALQLTAVVNSSHILTRQTASADSWGTHSLIVTLLVMMFTMFVGMRRLDPTERHPGMISALVAECLIKLVAAISIGIFVCWWLYESPLEILQQAQSNGLDHLFSFTATEHSGARWLTLIVLGFVGIQLLPRQFHVAVIENSDVRHLKTALWLFPLYMVLINLFIVPIAAAGLMMGLPADDAEYYSLLLPIESNAPLLTLLTFLGGFSAATGMILITTVALATMVTNHLLLPLIERFARLNRLKHHLLQIRWLSAALLIATSYLFARSVTDSYLLVAIGLLSFTAMLQLAPTALGGLFWRGGNQAGALMGLSLGFLTWGWTLLVPTFAPFGLFPDTLLEQGPWGIELLRPQALLGVEGLPDYVHTSLWSLLFNIAGYIMGSLFFQPDKQERNQAASFLNACKTYHRASHARPVGLEAYIELAPKLTEARLLLEEYLTEQAAQETLDHIVEDLQVDDQSRITIIELIELHRMLEHRLAGSLGSASAHKAIENMICYSKRESADLKALYSHIVCDLQGNETKRSPEPLPTDCNLDLLEAMQQQLSELQATVRSQEEQIATLEHRLEASYDEAFSFRLEAQKLRQENIDLLRQRNANLDINNE